MVIAIYVMAFGRKLAVVDGFLMAFLAVGVVGIFQSAAALLVEGGNLLALPLGIRNYYPIFRFPG